MEEFKLKPSDEIIQLFFEHFAQHPNRLLQEEFEGILKELGVVNERKEEVIREKKGKNDKPAPPASSSQKKKKTK